MAEIPQSKDDLQRHLQEQLGFLERSAEAFDDGFEDEAKRLASTIRLLAHDTSVSRSLLSQLNLKSQNFHDTTIEIDRTNNAAQSTLVAVSVAPQGVKHVPLLDSDSDRVQLVDFKTWWNKAVTRDLAGRELTRRDLVLAIANKDGGAHVDPALDEEYARLSRKNALGRYIGKETETIPLIGVELVSIRQIAHEVLKSLKAGYQKKPKPRGGATISDTGFHIINL